jgi:glutaminyl-tRNA synthetase
LRCTYDPATKGGNAPDNRKVKSTLHWVSAKHAFEAEVRLYDYLFLKPDPDDTPEGGTWLDNINQNSLIILNDCKLEPALNNLKVGDKNQFERQGFFCVDPDTTPERMVFNRIFTIKDNWSKIKAKLQQENEL